MIAPLERFAANPLVSPSDIPFATATGTFNPAAAIDQKSGRVVLLVRVFEKATNRSCLGLAISSDGERIDEHAGRFYTLRDALVEPRPIQASPPS